MVSPAHVADDSIRVLFIEDDPAVAEMYKLKLELDGYHVTILTPGEDPGVVASQVLPELVFLDTQRHEDAGIAALRALRRTPATKAVPVIILSNQQPEALAAAGLETDVMDYVVHADLSLSSLSRDIDRWALNGRPGLLS